MWNLWIDDQLDDLNCLWRHTPEGFLGAKSCTEAITLVKIHGVPNFIDLDCDLADGKDVQTFLRWLFEHYPNNPPDYAIHSKNPVARENAAAFMKTWHRVVKESEENAWLLF